jgi:hypothetical protein
MGFDDHIVFFKITLAKNLTLLYCVARGLGSGVLRGLGSMCFKNLSFKRLYMTFMKKYGNFDQMLGFRYVWD